MNKHVNIPLCVDLDGTLVKLDTLHQAIFLLLRRDFSSLFRIPGWLLKGKAYFKDQVMQRIVLDAEALPYNQTFLAWLREQKDAGRKLILATASNYRTANAVAEHLGIFDDIIASDTGTNLLAGHKLKAIQERCETFAYAGNDRHDIPIWKAAAHTILVNPSPAARSACEDGADYVFDERRPFLRMLIKAMRCEQWIKNLLIFTPMLLAHRYNEPQCILQTVLAFFSFSLAASAIYVLNDLFDLSADQHHPRKCRRPFASGDLPIAAGAVLIPLLTAASLSLCIALPLPFLLVLLTYYIMTTFYSMRLKQLAVIDVLTLAILFSVRIFAGALATGTPASAWFIEFAIFLFLSLAQVKRLSELRELETAPDKQTHRERGYTTDDLPLLLSFGAASGYISVLVFTMYLGSENVTRLYQRPDILWVFCPLLLYWITRIWHLAWRGQMKDDPLAFAARDFQTYLIGALGLAAILFAI